MSVKIFIRQFLKYEKWKQLNMVPLRALCSLKMSSFKYTHAIVCRIPNSFKTGALQMTGTIDLDLARKQHESYVKVLRGIGLDVIELPPDENYPDCLFVEDTTIVCNGSALICRPAEPSRRGEVDYMRNIMKTELELPVAEVEGESATLDGGDVLFTGREIFVGISGRTNEAGAAAVAATFPDYPCSPIKVDKYLHLKSMMSMAGPDVICIANDPCAQDALKRIENLATFQYKTLTVPDIPAANVVFANGTLIVNRDFPDSVKIFEERMAHWDIKPISCTEINKASGLFTCCSVLVRKTKHMKSIS